jgi:hypothetical protein
MWSATSSRIFLNLNHSAVGLFPFLHLKPCNPSNVIYTGRAAVCAVRWQDILHSARRSSFKRCVPAKRTQNSVVLGSRQSEPQWIYHPGVVKCMCVKEHLHAFNKLQSSRKWVASFTLRTPYLCGVSNIFGTHRVGAGWDPEPVWTLWTRGKHRTVPGIEP